MPSLLFLLPVVALQSQQLTATELSLGATASLARETFVGGEVGLARRTSNETRIALAVAGGTAAASAAGRAQLTFQAVVNPAARTGMGLYAGLGAAFSGREGSRGQGFVAVLLGLEGAPGRRRNWYAELGLGGGVRLAAGWRMRWFPDWWKSETK
ncbi:MAG TPA: hypothetical protein VG454_14700 [Gemmatimonadales bacterium]|nr:hypothetical protein [Gemmatimonadales bacterium]